MKLLTNSFNKQSTPRWLPVLLLISMVLLAIALPSLAATTTIFNVAAATGNPTSIAPQALANVTISNLTLGPGITHDTGLNTCSGGFLLANSWTTNATRDANDYLQFTITPDAGYDITYTSLTYGVTTEDNISNNTYQGPLDWELRYSTDGFVSSDNLLATHTLPAHNNSDTYDQQTFTDTISSIGTQAVTITFRLYGYNQPAGASQFAGAGTSNATGSACTGNFADNWSGTGSDIILDATVSASSAPEIDVQGNGQSISNGSTTPSTSDDTDFGSYPVIGSPITHTFTISNSGNANLTLTGVPAVTLTYGTAFTVTQPASTTIGAGAVATFTVAFDPLTAGSFTDTVNIANNDADENPYTFVISGTGTAAAALTYTLAVNIAGNGRVDLAPSGTVGGGTVNFASVYTAGTVVTMTATPDAGWQFDGWSGSLLLPNGSLVLTTSVTMDQDRTVTATFSPSTNTADLSISKSFVRSLSAVTYTIVARNLGPGAADGAVVRDDFAAHIANVSWTCAASGGAACTPSGSVNISGTGDISETLGSFPVGGVVTYTAAGGLGIFDDETNTATITVPEGVTDPDLSNNTATVGKPYKLLLMLVSKNWSP